MGRTHTTQHELSAIAPNFQWEQLFASLGFADIRVGATSADIVGRGRAHVHARADALLHALPARKRLRPLSPHAYLPTPPVRPPAHPSRSRSPSLGGHSFGNRQTLRSGELQLDAAFKALRRSAQLAR
jgi:hypothetical protein